MYRKGHYGVSLLVYAPLGFAFVVQDALALAFLAGVGILWLSMLPDVDHRLPGVSHRGVTHTVAFAALVGVALGGAGYVLAPHLGVSASSAFAFGGFVGTAAVCAHLLADALTPMGVRPLWPFSSRRVSLSLTRADDALWNVGLLAVGVFVNGAVLYLAATVTGVTS